MKTPIMQGLVLASTAALVACATPTPLPSTPPAEPPIAPRLSGLLPADVLLLGEQHDASEHQAIQRDTVVQLAARGQLAALVMEMAEAGRAARLPPLATEAEVRDALRWDAGWPWADYGPVVMAAVRAGVPVLGANLPQAQMRRAMQDPALDTRLPADAWATQQRQIADGHCGLLPAQQLPAMARIQVARDRSMAQVAAAAVQPGKTVLLVAGNAHVDRQLGIPQHLPAGLQVKAVRMLAAASLSANADDARFDAWWLTPPLPDKDHCAELRERFKPKGR